MHRPLNESRLLIALPLLCAAGALWLLLSPTAFRRRALAQRAEQLAVEAHAEWVRNAGLERWRDGLAGDPSVIEREARKLGYGRPGETSYPPAPKAFADAIRPPEQESVSWTSEIGRSVAPVLMLIIAGVIMVLFFTDLKVEDPGTRRAAPEQNAQEAT